MYSSLTSDLVSTTLKVNELCFRGEIIAASVSNDVDDE